MKDYNEMAKSVFERRDEYLTARKKKRTMLFKAGIPLCSLVLVTMMSLLLWQAKLPEMPKKPEESTVNITEQTNPDDTSEGAINSQVGEITGVQHSSVQAMQSQGTNVGGNEYIPKPTQPYTQKYTGDLPQSQGGKPINPQPNTGGVVHPDSPDKPVVPGVMGKPDPTNCTMSEDFVPPTYVPEEPPATLPGEEMTLPALPNEGRPNEYPFVTESVVLTTEPAVMPTTSSVPEPTGPLEITVADKTYVAQVGDKVTYTLELKAQEQFENIQLRLSYGKDNLSVALPKDVDGETICEEVVPNLAAPYVNAGYGKVKMNASNNSQYTKFDFREKKVLLTMDFMVTHSGKTEIIKYIDEILISSEKFEGGWIDGVHHNEYTTYRYYYQGDKQIIEGTEFEEYLTVTPAKEILPPEKPKPEETPDFVYPEENTDGDLLIHCNDRVYSADVGQRITYIVELEAAERFENFFVHVQYDGEMLDILPPEYLSEDDIPPEEVTMPNTSGVVINYHYKKQAHIVASGSWLGKYNFKNRKVFLTLDFIVKSEGEVNMDFWVDDMCISSDREYFWLGEAVITEGIEFYEYVVVN